MTHLREGAHFGHRASQIQVGQGESAKLASFIKAVSSIREQCLLERRDLVWSDLSTKAQVDVPSTRGDSA